MERSVFGSATPRSSSRKGAGATRRSTALAGSLTVVAVAATLVVAPSAVAAPAADVSTDPTGAHVRLTRRGAWVEVRAPRDAAGGGGGGGSPASGCLRRWVPTQYPAYQRPSRVRPDIIRIPMPPRPGPGYVAYHVYCAATYVTSVWLPPDAFGGAAPVVDPRAVAEELVRDLPYPAATIGISPDARGLTGLESWFWVVGYAGPLRDAVDELGIRVEVEATPGTVRWDFGDGTAPVPGSLGRAAPARSDVVHVYEERRSAAPAAVRALVRLDVRYRVDGGPWLPLDPVLRVASRGYPVAESRAALVPAG
jgi:hypothetical protein